MNCDIHSKLMHKTTTGGKIMKPEYNFKNTTIPSYDINGMSSQDLQISLRRIREIPQQPFSFLANICEIFDDENQLAAKTTKPTEIDVSHGNYVIVVRIYQVCY